MDKATTLFWPQVGVQGNRDPQEVLLTQDPTIIDRDSVIVKNGDPAAMARNGCSKVLQKRVGKHQANADQKESHLKDLEPPQAANVNKKVLKGHLG